MPALSQHFLHEYIVLFDFFDGFAFYLSILFQRICHISKRLLQFHGTMTGLATVRFIYKDSKAFPLGRINLIVNHWKLL
ncbi:hypothetical protein SDC9_139345 [bioreactor metagenome]|uniref:Uncharacterized protein n=1 Tax=bioreactor metagenome TaxID=1076179 RepID=A0A645DRW0_9ZZZZ